VKWNYISHRVVNIRSETDLAHVCCSYVIAEYLCKFTNFSSMSGHRRCLSFCLSLKYPAGSTCEAHFAHVVKRDMQLLWCSSTFINILYTNCAYG